MKCELNQEKHVIERGLKKVCKITLRNCFCLRFPPSRTLGTGVPVSVSQNRGCVSSVRTHRREEFFKASHSWPMLETPA